MRRWAALGLTAFTWACGEEPVPLPLAVPAQIEVTELASSNVGGGPGAARDEHGDYDDWIELHNKTDLALNLAGLWVSDTVANAQRYQLPTDQEIRLEPGGYLLLFADGETFQGPRHLPFSLDKDGEGLVVSTSTLGQVVKLVFPALAEGQSYARGPDGRFMVCRTPTPGAANECKAEEPPERPTYAPYDWPAIWPPPLDADVVISELDPWGTVTGTPTVELWNRSAAAVDLSQLELWIARVAPPAALPQGPVSMVFALGGTLPPGGVVTAPISALTPESGVVGLSKKDGTLWDRAVYEGIAAGTVLALPPDGRGIRIACDDASASFGQVNGPCLPPGPRTRVPPYVSEIRSEADLLALGTSEDELGSDAISVKFIIDRQVGNQIYFIDSARWLLHFDWIWEVVERNPAFDLCIPAERARHDQEWGRFSAVNYFQIEARRYYLGTLIWYRDSDLYTVEFTAGDRITPAMMEEAFFRVSRAFYAGKALVLRPTTEAHERSVLAIEGHLPIVPADEPFLGQTFQALNANVGYGVLTYVPADQVDEAPLSFQSIALFDRIPNDVPLVGGTITEAFQTPLAHVNVLAQNRGTPNMALKNARQDPRIAPFLDKLVRFTVTRTGFELRVATSSEAEAFWEERAGEHPRLTPPRDLSRRGLVDLSGASLADLPRVGAKAAQLAELLALDWPTYGGGAASCRSTTVQAKLPVPRPAFALPFAYFVDHLQQSGAKAELDRLALDPEFNANPAVRREALAHVRDLIREAPVDPALLAMLESTLAPTFGQDRIRLRSSTNVEDLVGFNGAGLYESHSAQLGSEVRPIADALRDVWASVYSFRGFEERRLYNVDESQVAMGVLIHRGFPAEEANGVAITRNIVNPNSHGFYLNAQVGELSVVNPPTGDLPEQLIYQQFFPPEIKVLGRSTATKGAPVLREAELHTLACALTAVHERFKQLYADRVDPADFAVDAEFKVDGPDRQVMLKQARPFLQAKPPEPSSCD